MLVNDQLDNISKMLEDLEKKQLEIDKKTKSTEEYRELNGKLIRGIYVIIVSFALIVITVVLCASCLVGNVANTSIKENINKATSSTSFSTGSDSIILNDVNETEVGNISN